MPSFFFHLIFDLDRGTESGLYLSNSDRPASHSTTQVAASRGDERPGTAISEEQSDTSVRTRSHEAPLQSSPASSALHQDWRYDKILTQTMAMPSATPSTPSESKSTGQKGDASIANGISIAPGGLATKGRYEPLDAQHEEQGWGVVRLYRDAEETPGLYDETTTPKQSKTAKHLSKGLGAAPQFLDEDCTTLCILAVPSYLTPSDFLGFVGEKTRDQVSHFRMIRTERGNRYMVLMKFRDGKKAREWRRAWNGKSFDGMEVCLHIPCRRYSTRS